MPLRFIGGMTPAQLVTYLENNYLSWTETWITNISVLNAITNALAKNSLVYWLFNADEPTDGEFNPIDENWSPPNWTNVEGSFETRPPCDIRILGYAIMLSAAPGAGASRTFTLRDDGVDTALAVPFVLQTQRQAMLATPIVIAAGSVITWRHNRTGAPAATTWMSLKLIYELVL